MPELRSLVIVLGDQLDRHSSAFDDFDPARDSVWMAETVEESTHVWSAKQRIAIFLTAMRHFADDLRTAGMPLDYTRLGRETRSGSMSAALSDAIDRLKPQRLVMCAPGDWRVYQSLREVAAHAGLVLDVREDRHFFGTVREF
ncbi:MAG: cryptochrome/photolyase family protein, partial [Chitinophagaceae bacterium]|nr:cryptochrome/photolyase family protein [Rubrivivax sp.]